MSDIGHVLFTAKEALRSNLTAINVTSSNIANVNTPGYTRLRPVFASVGTQNSASNREQIGVTIANVQRIYDKFLENQIVQQQATVGNYSAQDELLQSIEAILNENRGGGINDALGDFLNAWSDLSTDPASQTKRDMVVAKAQNLAYVFSQRAEDLINTQLNADQSVVDTVVTLNGYLTQMAAYNESIVNTESAGGSAAALRDKRGELLGQISSLIDVNYIERSDGSLYIYLPTSGKALVEGNSSRQLQTARNADNNNLYDIVFAYDPANSINNEIAGGKLAGLLAIRDTTINSYLDQLNQTAASIINKVNGQHLLGYDQDGNPGALFFTNTAEARYMEVSANISADVRKIAASATVNADGNNAAAITALANDQMYASLGSFSSSVAVNTITGRINNIGQAYKDSSSILLTRGAAAGSWALTSNGGYASLSVLSADDSKLYLDLNADGAADITLGLTGAWNNGDTVSFNLTKSSSTTNIDGYFNAFIAKMGQDVEEMAQALHTQTTITEQYNTRREEVSGVSLDEEMINLIQYQMAYNAAGRMTQTVSELMDTLINIGR